MNRLLKFALLTIASALSANAYADSITIPAHGAEILDGDTIRYGGKKYRFHGIDAPEKDQFYYCDGKKIPAGSIAKGALDTLISNRRITCEILNVDYWGRGIIRCRDRNGNDINKAMVRLGYAFAYTQYSLDYVADHEAAMAENVGLWPFNPEMPWIYRREKK